MNATRVDKKKPGFDLSSKYHKNGLTIANVKLICSVLVHGNFLYSSLALHISHHVIGELTIAKRSEERRVGKECPV